MKRVVDAHVLKNFDKIELQLSNLLISKTKTTENVVSARVSTIDEYKKKRL